MKTAVKWLAKELESYGDPQICKITWEDLDSLVNQAKEMEKQQLNDAYNADRPNLTCYEENTAFKEYYNETFNNED